MMKKLCFCAVMLLCFGCKTNKETAVVIDGLIQGTYYHIIFYGKDTKEIRTKIDSIFTLVDNSLSLWNDNSLISKVNSGEDIILDSIFIRCFDDTKKICDFTEGYLDFTVGILTEKYGFLNKTREETDSSNLKNILQFVNYRNTKIENSHLIKQFSQTKLDFNATAQGLTTDLVCEMFMSNDIRNFIVDVGGEVRAAGKKPDGKLWKCAIENPSQNKDSERIYETFVMLDNESVVTSGNYRKYIEIDGKRYAHTINPFTGESVQDSLLSASVICPTAIEADGIATALMSMGYQKAKAFVIKNRLKAHLIYFSNGKYEFFTNNTEIKHL